MVVPASYHHEEHILHIVLLLRFAILRYGQLK